MTEGTPPVPSFPQPAGPGQPVPAPPGPPPAPAFPPPTGYGPPPAPGGPPGYAPPGYGPPQFPPYGGYPPPVGPPPVRRPRRWLWITLGAVVLVLALCAGSAVALKSQLDAEHAASAAELDEKYNPIREEEIEALLDARGRALRAKDLKAFLAPFDPANKALVAQQTRLFRNLLKVPLAEQRFERVTQTDFKRAGERVTVDVTISFVHRFEFDLTPVEELYRWTLLRPAKGVPVKVTKAGGLPVDPKRDRLTYYPAPWDKWSDLHVERTPHTVILVDGRLTTEAKRYAQLAERAAVADLASWRSGGVAGKVPQGFVLSLVKGKKELGSLYRVTKELPDESGVSIPVPPAGWMDTQGAGGGPDVGASRVVIDVADKYFFSNGAALRANIFRHEFAHSIVFNLRQHDPKKYAADDLENWVVEGFAEWMGAQRQSWTKSDRAPESRRILRSLGYDLPMPSNFSWDMSGRGSYHYWLGHSAMTYIAERYGERKVFEFVATHYRGRTVQATTKEVLGVSYATFCDQWAAYVVGRMR
ncbi:hypothetical protein K7640_16950 [Micromonospora sp. PLK6-60]|uniref:hypothetical protein n=1 Tax=Micromonospora sp. PLK6-60 TaxID=2873383 RepID=UPI001CA6BD9A|nr:hypothetical protein [Micromonospora sp. PLK6-60]MBY8873526.1 hypothetical protein [Micromonospora sp. PLK6-60]